jgi:hypothetical protein
VGTTLNGKDGRRYMYLLTARPVRAARLVDLDFGKLGHALINL